jgi:serine/threonine-protein kinase RsbW
MAVVELTLPALTAHVRTARMVCVTAARRAGLRDDLLDEFRLAVGEACARAVGLHARHAPDELVTVRVSDDVSGLTVTVHDCGPEAGPAVADLAGGLLEADAVDQDPQDVDVADPDVALALLGGLVDEVDVSAADGSGTTVTLRWPLQRRPGGTPSTVLAE